jgi:hypothetical protein
MEVWNMLLKDQSGVHDCFLWIGEFFYKSGELIK